MTIHLIESWASYATVADMPRRWPYTLGNGPALSGGGCLMDGSVVSYNNAHIPPITTLMAGFNLTCQAFAPTVQNSSMLHCCGGGDTNNQNQVGLGVNPDGTLSVFFGSNFSGYGGTTLANGTTALQANVNYWIEYKLVLHPTAGSVEVRINGAVEILLTGINTIAQQSVGWVNVVSLVAAAGAKHLYGGLYIGDGAEGWMGRSDAQMLSLSADTAQKTFSPSTGTSNYTLLNDLSTYTTYVSSGNTGDEDRYLASTLSTSPKIVQVSVQAKVTDAANLIKSLIPVINDGTNQHSAGAQLLGSSLPGTWSNSPRGIFLNAADGAPWTAAKFNATQFGMRIASWRNGFNFRSTATYVTDSPADTYVLNDVYPTTRGAATFGWDIAGSGTVKVDRTTSLGPKYAGVNCQKNTGTQRTFKVVVPVAGRYLVKLDLGDPGSLQTGYYAQLLDGAGGSVLGTIDSRSLPSQDSPSGSIGFDASGQAGYAFSAHDEYSPYREITLTGTEFAIRIGTPVSFGAFYSCIAHLELIALDYVPAPVALAPTVQVGSLIVEALVPIIFYVPPPPPPSHGKGSGGTDNGKNPPGQDKKSNQWGPSGSVFGARSFDRHWRRRALKVLPADGAQHYSLAANSAAFVLSAAPSAGQAKRQISASAAAYLDLPATAAVSVKRILAAAPATFALSASAAACVAKRYLPASSGSIVLASSAAQVQRRLSLGSSGASYADAASASSVTAKRKIAAAPAVVALTGTAAASAVKRAFSASPAAYALAGSVSALAIVRRLAAAPGEFSDTASAATLTETTHGLVYSLAAAPGALALSARAAATTAKLKVGAAPGSYSVGATAATIAERHTLAAAPAAFTETGAVAAFKTLRKLPAAPAAITDTGSAATLAVRTNYSLTATPAAFVVTCPSADVVRNRRMAANGAVFTVIPGGMAGRTALSLPADPAALVWGVGPSTLALLRRNVFVDSDYLLHSPQTFRAMASPGLVRNLTSSPTARALPAPATARSIAAAPIIRTIKAA